MINSQDKNGLDNESIKSESKLSALIKQFIKFGIVGVINTFISLAIYYIFVFINEDLYIVGNTVGFIVTVFNAFILNSKFVFKLSGQKIASTELIKTFVCYGTTLAISTGLLYVMVQYLSVSEFLAPIFNLFVTAPLNFFLIKFWAMKKKETA